MNWKLEILSCTHTKILPVHIPGSYSCTSCIFIIIVMGRSNNLIIPLLFYNVSANYINNTAIPTQGFFGQQWLWIQKAVTGHCLTFYWFRNKGLRAQDKPAINTNTSKLQAASILPNMRYERQKWHHKALLINMRHHYDEVARTCSNMHVASTHLVTQWAAVRTHWVPISAPPQRYWFRELMSATCQHHSAGSPSSPPTTRPCLSRPRAVPFTPHTYLLYTGGRGVVELPAEGPGSQHKC